VLARDGVCVSRAVSDPSRRSTTASTGRGVGRTDLSNLDGLCKGHHRLAHEGNWSIERDDTGGVTFRRPDGTILQSEPLCIERADGRIEAENHARGLSISAETCVPTCYGDPLDLDWTVAGLCETAGL
jgi:hypothetical protein